MGGGRTDGRQHATTTTTTTKHAAVAAEEVAALVDAKMKELSGVKGRSSTVDVAVLTALNLGHELMELKQNKQGDDNQLNQQVDSMIQKLDKSLEATKIKGNYEG